MEEEKLKKEAEKRMKDKWIKSQMFIEVLALQEDAAKEVLEAHVKKLENEGSVLITKKDWKPMRKIEKPFPNIDIGYGYFVELEVLTENYDKLVYVAMNYGPSSIEIIEPKEIKLQSWEADGIVNGVADMMHRFAASKGGFVLKKV